MEIEFYQLAQQLGQLLLAQDLKIATAESCTGGWISTVLTEVPGSSAWFDRGFVTYSNAAKMQMLDVSAETLAKHGAVSEQTAMEMLQGALKHSVAQSAIAVTGIAGPDGGSIDKPVGTVYIAWVCPGKPAQVVRQNFTGTRQQIRANTVHAALQGLILQLTG
ncbi:MAG: CinA family protein [Methylococcales bacterium]